MNCVKRAFDATDRLPLHHHRDRHVPPERQARPADSNGRRVRAAGGVSSRWGGFAGRGTVGGDRIAGQKDRGGGAVKSITEFHTLGRSLPPKRGREGG